MTWLLLGAAEAFRARNSSLLISAGIAGPHAPFTSSPEDTERFRRRNSLCSPWDRRPEQPKPSAGTAAPGGRREEGGGGAAGRGEAGRGWEATGEQNESVQPLQNSALILLIFVVKLSCLSLHLFTGKDGFGVPFPFPRFTELLEGVAAAESCSGEKHALSTRRKGGSWQCLSPFVNRIFS